jgi:hypothetical protein
MGAVLAAVGLGTALGGMFGKKDKAPAPVAAPVAPTVANAEADAKAQAAKKRRISMLQGGNTNLTQQTNTAGGAGAAVGTKSLLGA